MKKIFYLALIVLAFAACKKDKQAPDRNIVASWHINAGVLNYYLSGKLVSTAPDTIGKDLLDEVWQFDGNGNLTVSRYQQGAVNHDSDVKYSYQLKDDSVFVLTQSTRVAAFAFSKPDNNTLVINESEKFNPARVFYNKGDVTADLLKTTVTFKKM